MKKTTNPALMKRYFTGEAVVGDHSKDMIVEPFYALVFNGKVPYQKEKRTRMMAWLPKNKTQFHVYKNNAYPQHIDAMLATFAPDGALMVDLKTDIYLALNLLNRLAAIHEPESNSSIIERLNYHLRDVDEKALWSMIDERKDNYQTLWTTGKDLQGVDDKVGVEIVTRRLMS